MSATFLLRVRYVSATCPIRCPVRCLYDVCTMYLCCVPLHVRTCPYDFPAMYARHVRGGALRNYGAILKYDTLRLLSCFIHVRYMSATCPLHVRYMSATCPLRFLYGVCTMPLRCAPAFTCPYMSVRCPYDAPAMYEPCSWRRATQLRCHLKVRHAGHPPLRHPCLYVSATCPYMSVHVRTCPYMSVRCPVRCPFDVPLMSR